MPDIADTLRQRTFRYNLRIIIVCRKLPNEWVDREIGKQLLRSGMGVAGNYWSCCRGRSDKEFIAKLGVAVDEGEESVLWLNTIIESGIRTDAEMRALLGEGIEIRAILSKSHKTARDNQKRQKRESRARRSANSPTR